MAKKIVVCPNCGHQFPANFQGIRGQTAGVRFTRTTEGQFQAAIDVPGEMVEHQKYYTVGDQLLGALVIGVSAGALTGYFASIPWHVSEPGIAAEIILGSTLTGWAITSFGLIRVRTWEMCKALPMAVGQYLALAEANMPGREGPTLTIDHRYRDGSTETGRTIQYFGTLPVDVDRFTQWAAAVLGNDKLPGQSLAIAHWTGSNGLFSRKEYEAVLAVLRRAEAVINQPGKGNMLTGGGRRALRQHLKAHSPTSPQERA